MALNWPRLALAPNQSKQPLFKNLKLLYPGKVTPAMWDKIYDLVIARSFKHCYASGWEVMIVSADGAGKT